MRSTKAVDKLPQAMLGATTKNADKLHQQARLRYAHITLSCFPSPEHVAQIIYVLFMSWCLGRSKKGYVLFFWASPVLCLFSQGKKNKTSRKTTQKTRHP